MTEALFDEVLEGLESIHKTGLAHMDMKPATGRIWADVGQTQNNYRKAP